MRWILLLLNRKLRGKPMADKLVEKRVLQAYQCDRFSNVRPLILMNELQSIADRHAELLGLENNVGWVVMYYLVDIVELPTEGEELTFSTWPSCQDALRATRDFEIHGSDGRLMVRATSQWILIDMDARRPLPLASHLSPDVVVPSRAYGCAFEKFPDFETTKTHVMKCRFDDIDVNQHINNAVYAVWATESVGYKYRSTHKLKKIDINFKKEINPDTPEIRIDVAIDGLTTRHKICTGDTEHARVICHWDEI